LATLSPAVFTAATRRTLPVGVAVSTSVGATASTGVATGALVSTSAISFALTDFLTVMIGPAGVVGFFPGMETSFNRAEKNGLVTQAA
jgi:hypothetical protein